MHPAQHGIPRSSKRLAETPATARAFSHRDTKRWCRGLIGKRHVTVWQYQFGGGGGFMGVNQYMLKKCLECGRHLDYCVVNSLRPPTAQLIAMGKLSEGGPNGSL